MANPRNFNPGQLLVRWGWEHIVGVPVPTKWHDIEVHGEKVGSEAEYIERTAIQPSGMRLAPLVGKLKPGGDIVFDCSSPRQDWWPWANMLGGYDAPSLLETGAYLHKIHRLGATQFPPTFALRVDRNDGMPSRYASGRISQIALKFGANKLTEATAMMVSGQEDFWAAVALLRSGGTATSLR